MLGFSIVVFITNVQSFLILTPYTIHSPHLKGIALARYTGSVFIHQLTLTLALVVLLAIAGFLLFLHTGPSGIAAVVRALAISTGFILFWDCARRISLAGLNVKAALLLDSGMAALQMGTLLILARLGFLSATSAYWALGASCGLSGLVWLVSIRNKYDVRLSHVASDFRKNLSTGRWIFASGLLWSLGSYLYPWIIAFFHGTASTGTWAACQGVAGLANPLFMGLQNSFGPKITHVYAGEGVSGLHRFTLRSTAILGGIILPFCVVLVAVGGYILTGLYGSKYDGNGLIVALLALNMLTSALAFPPSRALFTIERADLDFRINLVTILILFSAGIPLVRHLGPLGAALGLLLSSSVSCGLLHRAFFRLPGVKGASTVREPEILKVLE